MLLRYDEWREWYEPKAPGLYDWSPGAMQAFHDHTTHGTALTVDIFGGATNGYMKAHSMVNFHVEEWGNELLAGRLFKFEIYDDSSVPAWLKDSFRKSVEGICVEHFAARDHILLRSRREGWRNIGSVLYARSA